MKKLVFSFLFAAAVLLLGSSPASAQTSDTIRKDTPFTVVADHDGVDTDTYNLYQNGVKVQIKTLAQAFLNGTVTFDRYVAGLPKGTYVFYVEAVGPGGVTSGAALTLTVTPNPPKEPTNTRIVR